MPFPMRVVITAARFGACFARELNSVVHGKLASHGRRDHVNLRSGDVGLGSITRSDPRKRRSPVPIPPGVRNPQCNVALWAPRARRSYALRAATRLSRDLVSGRCAIGLFSNPCWGQRVWSVQLSG
jgi:hypothetical protein